MRGASPRSSALAAAGSSRLRPRVSFGRPSEWETSAGQGVERRTPVCFSVMGCEEHNPKFTFQKRLQHLQNLKRAAVPDPRCVCRLTRSFGEAWVVVFRNGSRRACLVKSS